MKIIANHAHVFQKSVREDGTIDSLRGVMDVCGIEKAVAFAPFHSYFSDDGKGPNVWLYDQIKNDDRFFGFGVIDFNQTDLKAQVRQILELGLNGIKLHPAFQQFNIMSEKALEVYAAAEEFGLPISFHTGVHWHRIKDYNMLLFDEVAYNFKNLKISFEHVGGYSFFKEGVAIMINNPDNTYAGLTSVFDREENRFWYLGKDLVEDLLWQTGAERSIFGLDFPYNRENKIQDAITNIQSLAINKEDKQRILGGNLLEFLKLG